MRGVSLARDTLTRPSLYLYQISSNYLRQCVSYGLQKISPSGEITTLRRSESRHSCSRHAYWSSSTFLPNIIEICLRVSKLWSAQGCVYGRTDAMLIAISPEPIGRGIKTNKKNIHFSRNVANFTLTCAPNEDSDQPAHSRSLIRICIKRI